MRLRGAVGAVPRGSIQEKHEREMGAPTSKPRKGDRKTQLKSEAEMRAWGEAGQGEKLFPEEATHGNKLLRIQRKQML